MEKNPDKITTPLDDIKFIDDNYITKKPIISENKSKSIPEVAEKVNQTEIPGLDETVIDKRHTISFPAVVRIPEPPKQVVIDLDKVTSEKLLNDITSKYTNLSAFAQYIEPSNHITRDLLKEEVDELKYLIHYRDEPEFEFRKIYYLADSTQKNIFKGCF